MSDLSNWTGALEEDPTEPDDDAVEEVEEPDEPEAAGVDDADTETEETDEEAPTEAPLIFGKYKSVEDAEKAYKELERQFHAQQQQPEEAEEDDEDDDPFGLWGTALGTDEGQRLAETIIQNPAQAKAVVEWAQENQHQFGPQGEEIAQGLFALWNAQNPLAAQSWVADQRLQALRDEMSQAQAPIQSHYTQQMASIAVHRATSELPRFAEFKDQIMESIQTPQMQAFLAANPEYASDPQKMYEVLQGAWTNLIAQEYRTTAQHAASASGEPAPGIPEKAKPRTQQRNTAAPPTTDDDVVGMFPAGFFRAG